MTTDAALTMAQHAEPHDLAKRVDYIELQRDRCDIDNLMAWSEALSITRHGETPRQRYDRKTRLPLSGERGYA